MKKLNLSLKLHCRHFFLFNYLGGGLATYQKCISLSPVHNNPTGAIPHFKPIDERAHSLVRIRPLGKSCNVHPTLTTTCLGTACLSLIQFGFLFSPSATFSRFFVQERQKLSLGLLRAKCLL